MDPSKRTKKIRVGTDDEWVQVSEYPPEAQVSRPGAFIHVVVGYHGEIHGALLTHEEWARIKAAI
jgi:hypothetical protein